MIGYFDGPLITMFDAEASKALGGNYWRVCKSFSYYMAGYPNRRVFVPAGYLTDGASVPRAAWAMIPPWGEYGQAAVMHDLLCEYLSVSIAGKPVAITREQCDALLYEAMQALGVEAFTAKAISEAVDFYRVLSRTNKPTNTAAKRALEAQWVCPFITGAASV